MAVSQNILDRLMTYINEVPRKCDGCKLNLEIQEVHRCVVESIEGNIGRHLDDALRTVLTIDELLDIAYSHSVDKLVKFENDRIYREYQQTKLLFFSQIFSPLRLYMLQCNQ
jgi:hypothetical protein